jgi:LPXTG-site transpeptidase (sortase) family protein
MGEYQSGQMNNSSINPLKQVLFICIFVLFLSLVLISPPNSTRAELLIRAVDNVSQADYVIYLPIIYQNFSLSPLETPTPTQTPTSTTTSTSTQTVTGTPATSTPTLTGTPPTSTPTGTPTITGTPPTPTWTATGTLIANPRLSMVVSPFQANVGGSFTFTIKVTNIGTTSANDAVLTDSFPDYIDVISVTTTKGTQNRSIHSASVNIGTVSPGEEITITIVVRANSRKLTTETVTNTVTLYYDSSGIRTASTSYRIVVTTLPGTGELPLDWQDASNEPLLIIQVLLMLGLGIILTGLGIWSWKRDSTNRYWMLGIGFILLVVSFITVLTEMQNHYTAGDPGLMQSIEDDVGSEVSSLDLPAATPSLAAHLPAYLFATPEHIIIETLPSYPIPTPDIIFTPIPEIEQPDTSAVERIIIPAILLDTEVKYVPFDGTTWLIRGLRYEVAWLGDTSWPGLGSNTVLAGHVTVSGIGNGPFRKLEDLGDGEFIFLHTEENTYTYRVRNRTIVEDWDMSVVQPSTSPQLTLITCVEWDEEEELYLKRLVLFADLVRVDPTLESSSY